MNQKYCLDKKEWKEAQAALLLAKQLGLIEDAGIGALEKRRAEKNEKNRQAEKAGEFFYGPHFYTPAMYLQYELTRFKLDFVQPSEKIKKQGRCPDFSEKEKREFYENNRDLFDYEDVRQVIEKRLREDAYDKLIQDILCQSENGV